MTERVMKMSTNVIHSYFFATFAFLITPALVDCCEPYSVIRFSALLLLNHCELFVECGLAFVKYSVQ